MLVLRLGLFVVCHLSRLCECNFHDRARSSGWISTYRHDTANHSLPLKIAKTDFLPPVLCLLFCKLSDIMKKTVVPLDFRTNTLLASAMCVNHSAIQRQQLCYGRETDVIANTKNLLYCSVVSCFIYTVFICCIWQGTPPVSSGVAMVPGADARQIHSSSTRPVHGTASGGRLSSNHPSSSMPMQMPNHICKC